jgi:hypothetical protein
MEQVAGFVGAGAHVLLLCDSIRRKERRIAESCGCGLVPYRKGKVDELVTAIVTLPQEELIGV